MEKSKRGRKPKSVSKEYPILNNVGAKAKAKIKGVLKKIDNEDNSFGLNQNLILHIPIASTFKINLFEDTTIKENDQNSNKIQYVSKEFIKNIGMKNNFINKFIKESQYPKSTDIKCWWCSYNFITVPCGIPFNYTDGCYEVYGCFCSFNCSLAYLYKNNFDKKNEKLAYLALMYRKIFNEEPVYNPSPPKELLCDYGGNMTIEEYRELCIDTTINKNIVLPPIVGIHAEIDTRNFLESVDHMNKKHINMLSNYKKKDTSVLKSDSFMDFFKHD